VKSGTAKLPSRVIAVSPTNNPTRPRLFTPNRAVAPYAALTYCWGYDPDCKTTRASLAEYLTALPLAQLPQTILDAITATRELGLAYLWVDALCIVQDDPDDVAAELSSMVDIYRGAYITISAAVADDSRNGFLSDRALTSVIKGASPIYLPYRIGYGSSRRVGTVGLVRNSSRGHVRDPIHSRAWTMQEHLLASRLLVYGSVQRFCVCGTQTLQCGNQYSLGSWMTRQQWEYTHQALCPPIGVPTMVPGMELPPLQIPSGQRFYPLQLMFATVFHDIPKRDFFKDDPVEKLIFHFILCRIMAEIFKGEGGVLDEAAKKWVAEQIQADSVRWTVEYLEAAQAKKYTPQAQDKDRVKNALNSAYALAVKSTPPHADVFAALPHMWKGIVEEFTSRQLTHHGDKMSALSAIASCVGSIAKDEYIVGLWRKDLLPQLLWRVAKPEMASRPVDNAQASHPTWSWSSIDGQVLMWPFHFERIDKLAIAEVMECTATPMYAKVPHGRVRNTTLRIKGCLQAVRLDRENKTARSRRPVSPNDRSVDIQLDHVASGGEARKYSKDIMAWCLPLVLWLPVVEWGIGHDNAARAIGGLVLDITKEGATRLGTFSGNRATSQGGCVPYGTSQIFMKEYSWLLCGAQTVVSLI
jgi:hypothetical protein